MRKRLRYGLQSSFFLYQENHYPLFIEATFSILPIYLTTKLYIRYMKRILLLFVLGKFLYLPGQDTLEIVLNPSFSIDFTGGFLQQLNVAQQSYQAQIYTPDYLSIRRKREPELQNKWRLNTPPTTTDAPFYHGPSYVSFHTLYHITPHITTYTNITVEHRGSSFGAYNLDNTLFYPRYGIRYKRKFALTQTNIDSNPAADSLALDLYAGWMVDYRNYEGLAIYNIDLNGAYTRLAWKNWEFNILHIGDLIGVSG